MIEPKYLMLGDWVQVKNHSLGFYNVMGRIIAINEMEGHALSKTFDISFVDDEDHKIHYIGCPKYNMYPIPLTPEILEKNEFNFGNTASEEDFCCSTGCLLPEEGWCYDEGAGEIKIIFPNESDGGLLRLDDQNADRHLELIFCNPLMVHQLQQALRLCGIDKEIILT